MRKQARDIAFKIIFEREVIQEKNDVTEELLCANCDSDDLSFIKLITGGVEGEYTLLKQVIEKYSKGFSFERIYKIDIAILLVSGYEILFTDIPFEVSANEAVNLAKLYSTDKSSGFINGVIASIIRDKELILNERNSEDN